MVYLSSNQFFSKYLRFGFICCLLLISTGCVQIVGEVHVDWRAQGEVGIKALFDKKVYRWVDPLIREQLTDIKNLTVERIEEGNKLGYRFVQPLEDVRKRVGTQETFMLPNVGFVEVETRDYFFFKRIELTAEFDLQEFNIPKVITGLIKPRVEISLPIRAESNADQNGEKGRQHIWHLSLKEPNHLWIRLWAPNLLNIVLCLGFVVGVVLIMFFAIRNRKRFSRS